MLNQFKTFDVNRIDMEELVVLSQFGRGLKQEYETLGMKVPEYIDTQLKTLRREIRARNQDRIEKELAEKKIRLESLQTPQEKKLKLKQEIKQLEEQLEEV